MCLNYCKNRGTSLKLNVHLSTILNRFCACSAQNNETPHHQRVGREERYSANKCLVIISPLVPVPLSLQGRVQNHVSCTASSLALFHLLKGWTQILTFSMEKQIFSTNLEINCWHFSPFTPLMCVKKKYKNIDLKGGEWEKSSSARGQPGNAEQRPPCSPGVLTVW